MQDLIELTALFRRTKFNNLKLLETIIDPETQMGRVFGLIFRQEAETDDDLRRLIPEFAADSNKLYTVKSKLKDRLLDLVFLLDFKEAGFADRQQAFNECTKRMASAVMLIGRGARSTGINLLEQLLRQTRRFEFTELTLDVLRTLRLHYSLMEGDEKKFESAEKEMDRLEEVWRLERRAESLYAALMVGFVQKKADKSAVAAQAESSFQEIAPYLDEVKSFKFQLFGRLLELAIYDGRHNYRMVADLCRDAIGFFEQKNYHSGLSLQVFYYNLLLSCLFLRSFDEAQAMAPRYSSLYTEGSFNWYKVHELNFLIAMHCGRYQEAHDVWQTVDRHPTLAQQPAVITEMWQIFGAFQHLLIRTGQVRVNEAETADATFRLSKFINTLVVFTRDKRGMNIPVMVIHFLFRMAEGKFELLADRADSLERYRKRHLDHPDTLRSDLFFQMLLQLPASGWKRGATLAATAGLRQKLQQTPLEKANQNHEIEIVPYETLWDIALGLLPENQV